MKRTTSLPLDLRQLHYFVAVAEDLSLSRAARRLHISQPPLTRHIKFIEETVGAQLFVRSARGVELTPVGLALLEDAKHLLELADQSVARARSAGRGELGHLTLGGFGALMLGSVPNFLREFRAAHPGITISLETLNRPEQVEALRERRVDAAFNRQAAYPSDLACEAFSSERMVVALPATDPLCSRTHVALRELADRPLIVQGSGPRPNMTDTLLGMCERAGLHASTAQEVGDSLTAAALVAGGFGIALVAESATFLQLPGVKYVPVSDATPGIVDIVCIYRKGAISPVLNVFIDDLRKFRRRPSAQYRP